MPAQAMAARAGDVAAAPATPAEQDCADGAGQPADHDRVSGKRQRAVHGCGLQGGVVRAVEEHGQRCALSRCSNEYNNCAVLMSSLSHDPPCRSLRSVSVGKLTPLLGCRCCCCAQGRAGRTCTGGQSGGTPPSSRPSGARGSMPTARALHCLSFGRLRSDAPPHGDALLGCRRQGQ